MGGALALGVNVKMVTGDQLAISKETFRRSRSPVSPPLSMLFAVLVSSSNVCVTTPCM